MYNIPWAVIIKISKMAMLIISIYSRCAVLMAETKMLLKRSPVVIRQITNKSFTVFIKPVIIDLIYLTLEEVLRRIQRTLNCIINNLTAWDPSQNCLKRVYVTSLENHLFIPEACTGIPIKVIEVFYSSLRVVCFIQRITIGLILYVLYPEGRIDILNNVTEFGANHAIKQELKSRFLHKIAENQLQSIFNRLIALLILSGLILTVKWDKYLTIIHKSNLIQMVKFY